MKYDIPSPAARKMSAKLQPKHPLQPEFWETEIAFGLRSDRLATGFFLVATVDDQGLNF
jgi:hypothetical protein